MSAATKADLEQALRNHYQSEVEGDGPEKENAVIVDWVVCYTTSGIIDVAGQEVIGYANHYVATDTNPNAQVTLAQWVAEEIMEVLRP
jgi:hypothetical protein